MAEKKKLITRTMDYSGLFDFKEIFRIIDVWLRQNHYDKNETRNFQYNLHSGKQYDLELKPWRKLTDYYNSKLKIEIFATGVKEVEVEGKRMQKGSIKIKISGYIVVDYDSKWNKPLLWFIRDLFDRYVYKEIFNKYADFVIEQTNTLYGVVAAYLNIERGDVIQ